MTRDKINTKACLSESVLLRLEFLGCFWVLLLMLGCQSQPSKVEPPDTTPRPTKSDRPDGALSGSPRKPNRQIKQNPVEANSGRKDIYCEGDFFDYSRPEGPFLGLTLQFVYDQRKTIDLILVNDQDQIIQRHVFKVKQKESLKLAQTHGNQTILATHPTGLKLPGFPVSKKIMALLPLGSSMQESPQTEPKNELFGTLNFQNSKNEFVGGNQKLNCSFDP